MHLNKRAITLKYNNLSFLKWFKRFFIGSLCGLLLETEYIDNLFVTTKPSKQIFKV
jgi:hypothetical protein